MGRVYQARDLELRRVVAVKLLTPELAADEEFRQRFEQEAWAAAGIQHGNVVQVYDVGEVPGTPPIPYLVFQYVEGVSLARFLEVHPSLPERRCRRLLRDIAAGLAAAHQRDLVHRDIKPANILIEHESGRAFVADFGISAALSPRAIGGAEPLADRGTWYGTPPYMSPEQTLGPGIGPPSDVYSFGVLAFEVVSRTLPFQADSPSAYMGAHRTQDPPHLGARRQGLSEELGRLITRCLRKDPRERPTASDLARDLVPSAEDEILWPPPGLAGVPRLGRRMRRTSAGGVLAFTILLIVLAARVPGTHTEAGWWNAWAGGSVIATSPAAVPAAGPVVLWQAVLLLSALALLAAMGILLQTVSARPRPGELRARGWRRETILDTLADPDGRTGLLLTGVREFGVLTSRQRDGIRRFRRTTHRALVVAMAWAAAVSCGWATSVLAGAPLQPAGGPPVGPVGLALGLGPIVVALVVAVNALLHERRATGNKRHHSATFIVPADQEGREVAAWYADLPGDVTPHPVAAQPPKTRLRILLQVTTALLLGWTVVAFGLLVLSVLMSGRLARRLGGDTAKVAAFLEGPDRGGALDSVRRVLAAFEPPPSPRGEESSRSLLALLSADRAGPIPPYLIDPRRALGNAGSELAPATLVANAMRRAREFSADSLRLLRDIAGHPQTLLLQRAAREGGPALAITEEMSIVDLRTSLEANAAGAVLAAAEGDLAGARARLGENAVIAKAALRAPGRLWPETGLRILQALVVLPLAEVARLEGNTVQEGTLRTSALVLAETLDQFGPTWLVGSIGLAGDPRDLSAVERLVSDTALPQGFRSGALESTADGACLNPREWLAGPDPRRRGALRGRLPIAGALRGQGIGSVLERVRYCSGLGRP